MPGKDETMTKLQMHVIDLLDTTNILTVQFGPQGPYSKRNCSATYEPNH